MLYFMRCVCLCLCMLVCVSSKPTNTPPPHVPLCPHTHHTLPHTHHTHTHTHTHVTDPQDVSRIWLNIQSGPKMGFLPYWMCHHTRTHTQTHTHTHTHTDRHSSIHVQQTCHTTFYQFYDFLSISILAI